MARLEVPPLKVGVFNNNTDTPSYIGSVEFVDRDKEYPWTWYIDDDVTGEVLEKKCKSKRGAKLSLQSFLDNHNERFGKRTIVRETGFLELKDISNVDDDSFEYYEKLKGM